MRNFASLPTIIIGGFLAKLMFPDNTIIIRILENTMNFEGGIFKIHGIIPYMQINIPHVEKYYGHD